MELLLELMILVKVHLIKKFIKHFGLTTINIVKKVKEMIINKHDNKNWN